MFNLYITGQRTGEFPDSAVQVPALPPVGTKYLNPHGEWRVIGYEMTELAAEYRNIPRCDLIMIIEPWSA